MYNYVWCLFFVFHYIWLSTFFWLIFLKHIHHERYFRHVCTIKYITFWMIKLNIHQLTNSFRFDIIQFKYQTWSIFLFLYHDDIIIRLNLICFENSIRCDMCQKKFYFLIMFWFFVFHWFLNSFSIRHFYFIEYDLC